MRKKALPRERSYRQKNGFFVKLIRYDEESAIALFRKWAQLLDGDIEEVAWVLFTSTSYLSSFAISRRLDQWLKELRRAAAQRRTVA